MVGKDDESNHYSTPHAAPELCAPLINNYCLQVGADGAVSPSLLLTCTLLHLLTLHALMTSVLKQFYNPMLTTIADNLDLQAVCEAVEQLDKRYTMSIPQVRPRYRRLGYIWVHLWYLADQMSRCCASSLVHPHRGH